MSCLKIMYYVGCKLPCCLNINNKFLGMFLYGHLHFATQVFKRLSSNVISQNRWDNTNPMQFIKLPLHHLKMQQMYEKSQGALFLVIKF